MNFVDLLSEPDWSGNLEWLPTREHGLRRLQAFLPNAGRRYAAARNHDLGPGSRSNVSGLSPWIRHRLVTEDEVVSAVLRIHGYRAAEKFIQEVLWRTYWKGWLEMRPDIWREYRETVRQLEGTLSSDSDLRKRFISAIEGRTGIECYDDWATELVEQGYLHNHTRMWFASIWIFTLKLPWELGADFFLRFLLDGDPASNTLSWRWVAGLQTPGKTYLARPSNIAKFTDGKYGEPAGLATSAPPLRGSPLPPPTPIPPVARYNREVPTGLLITEEDGHPESLDISRGSISAVIGLTCTQDRSSLPVGDLPMAFSAGAVREAMARASATLRCPTMPLDVDSEAEGLEDWIRRNGIHQVVTAYPPVGPVQERLAKLKGKLAGYGVPLIYIRREWDRTFWPHATKGFFPFKEKIPRLLSELPLPQS
jgi:deoxyribodipyrimidine photo-lyase